MLIVVHFDSQPENLRFYFVWFINFPLWFFYWFRINPLAQSPDTCALIGQVNPSLHCRGTSALTSFPPQTSEKGWYFTEWWSNNKWLWVQHTNEFNLFSLLPAFIALIHTSLTLRAGVLKMQCILFIFNFSTA